MKKFREWFVHQRQIVIGPPFLAGVWSHVFRYCHLSSHVSLTCFFPPVLYLMNLSWLLLFPCWKKYCWAQRSVLILLDLSAAFDTIDHNIQPKRLHELGIRDAALHWFRSYLSQRRQPVVINGSRSSYRNLSVGVPQGSVLGPISFTLYTTSLCAIARKYQLNSHLYADDTQLYLAVKPKDTQSSLLVVSNIQNCAIDIKSLVTANIFDWTWTKRKIYYCWTKASEISLP